MLSPASAFSRTPFLTCAARSRASGIKGTGLRTLEVMEQQSQQAMRLVEDLFDVCAGGLGKLPLRKELVELAGVVGRAAETARPALAARRPIHPEYVAATVNELATSDAVF